MRILLFDWIAGGHHARYLERVTTALDAVGGEVVIAAPDATHEEIGDIGASRYPLGSPRPHEDHTRPLRPQARALAAREITLFASAVRSTRPAHAVHMYGDGVIRSLAVKRSVGVPTTICIFYACAHYARVYGSRLSARERARADLLEVLIARWRLRHDAHAVFALDQEVVESWNRWPGAPVHWFPEPPVAAFDERDGASSARSGCVLYGALSPHKGIDRLVAAVRSGGSGLDLTFAGSVQAEFGPQLAEYIQMMRAAGATVHLHSQPHDEHEGLRRLRAARCAVLPYPAHQGMSRVLLEAAVAGTPLVVHDYGLLAYLVRYHRMGVVVDARDPRALREALVAMTTDPDTTSRFRRGLWEFAQRHSADRFGRAICQPFLDAGPRSTDGGPREQLARREVPAS
jgi:glycosyltransferase involved in cell wall biosynthesis